jgi:NADP-dependent 3-hydroxy acid dehydrogenase YdfG
VALVTGGTSGIGLAAAQGLAGLGMRVAICGRSAAEAAEGFRTYRCDVRDSGAAAEVIGRVIADWGGLDVLINSAGVSMPEPMSVDDIPDHLWDRILRTNLDGTFRFCREAMRVMRESGSGYIINILSTASLRSGGGNSPYSASKYGARALTEALINETQGTGIRVTGISPGAVDTAIWSHKRFAVTAERRAAMLRASDIADIVVFLLGQPERVHIENIKVTPWFPE